MFLIICFSVALLLSGCCTGNVAEIPFEYDTKKMPNIAVTFPRQNETDEGTMDFILGLDTGSEDTLFYNNAAEQLFDSQEEYVRFCAEAGIDVNNIEDGYFLSFTFPDVRTDGITFPKLSVLNTPHKNNALDGVLGYTAFNDYGVMVFDFRKNTLILGRRKIRRNTVPMKFQKFVITEKPYATVNLISIPVKINGGEKYVLLDTGCSSNGEPVLLLSDSDDMESATVTIGNNIVYKNVICRRRADAEFVTLEGRYEVLDDFIILGNAFFQNHRVQLDFERMEFAMD